MPDTERTAGKSLRGRRNHNNMIRFRVVQSAVAGLTVFLLFLATNYFQSNLAVTSLGASAFIVFCHPSARISCSRFLLGGYGIGAVCGILCAGGAALVRDVLPFPAYIPACALAVFAAMLLMTTLGLEHPPAAALAVAVTLDPRPVAKGIAALACIALLCVVRELLKKYLQDLSSQAYEGKGQEGGGHGREEMER